MDILPSSHRCAGFTRDQTPSPGGRERGDRGFRMIPWKAVFSYWLFVALKMAEFGLQPKGGCTKQWEIVWICLNDLAIKECYTAIHVDYEEMKEDCYTDGFCVIFLLSAATATGNGVWMILLLLTLVCVFSNRKQCGCILSFSFPIWTGD